MSQDIEYDNFKAEVNEFIDLYVREYMCGVSVKFSRDDEYPTDVFNFSADITMMTPYNSGSDARTMIIEVFEKEIYGIRTYEDNYLLMDGEGLYCWLWHEAEADLAKLKVKIGD